MRSCDMLADSSYPLGSIAAFLYQCCYEALLGITDFFICLVLKKIANLYTKGLKYEI